MGAKVGISVLHFQIMVHPVVGKTKRPLTKIENMKICFWLRKGRYNYVGPLPGLQVYHSKGNLPHGNAPYRGGRVPNCGSTGFANHPNISEVLFDLVGFGREKVVSRIPLETFEIA